MLEQQGQDLGWPADAHSLSLRQLLARSAGLEEDAFLKLYPQPFLVLEAMLESAEEDSRFATVTARVLLNVEAQLDRRVFPIIKRANNSFKNMITLGRTETNDLVISSNMISKLHAFFRRAGDDWLLTDCDSSNGTYISEQKLIATRSYPIHNGVDIHFSQGCPCIFYDPKGMYQHLQSYG